MWLVQDKILSWYMLMSRPKISGRRLKISGRQKQSSPGGSDGKCGPKCRSSSESERKFHENMLATCSMWVGVGGGGVDGGGVCGGGGVGGVISCDAFTIWCCVPISRPPRVIRRFKRRSCLLCQSLISSKWKSKF